MGALADLVRPWKSVSYGFLDGSAKRELRRKVLKAIAVPGCQVPYASREMPIARGWGTGGLQVTLTLVQPHSLVKVIDQGADDGVNAANIRAFVSRVSGAATTTDAMKATLIQSRHRIPEERLRRRQVLVLQVPDPEPLRGVEPNISTARAMHADADYGLIWLKLYEQLVVSGREAGPVTSAGGCIRSTVIAWPAPIAACRDVVDRSAPGRPVPARRYGRPA